MPADNSKQDSSQYTSIYSLAIPAGIKRDGTVFQNDQFTDGVWCRFQRGEPKKIGGFATLFTSFSGIFRGMMNVPYNGVNYIFAGTANTLDVFTTGTTYGNGSGPYIANFLPGIVQATVTAFTATQITVPGDATAIFTIGSDVIFTNTIGATTGAYYTTSGTLDESAFDNSPFEDVIDNTRIQSEADAIIDFTEVNPFGEP